MAHPHDLAAGCGGHVTAKQAEPFIARIWNPDRWARGAPKDSTRVAYKQKLRCSGPANRKALKHRWKKAKRAFKRHRSRKLSAQRYLEAISPPGPAVLAAIRACESGGDYSAVDSSGTYRGGYQFDYGTWASVGGSGDPAAATPREQDERAARLYRERGSSPWPVCGA